ncbi:S-layer homology domain-containing protein [Paenibacillus filicis]|uniref:S-layer homology domain-containing protein n=1 Tax=Paenibacillus gyeongsangnamensis TaxID=3388067 RepID=A0ABT4QF58_9BACL|nr:S-layer homology domain-containing protein [Paenibacillus filicis]MCZ8515492.1 S-layer homology domain-containing protein [Paenibacillus filicis]
MKKSLSAILSLAIAFSMFASVALGAEANVTKDSSSFSDLKDLDAATKAKFDEMIKASIFDGVKDGIFGVKDKMNRAQFAKVAALVFQLKVDTSVKTSTFSDVKADDPANGYALPYIEALVKAGITDGYAPGQFNPAGEVTTEQLAAFLLRGLCQDSAAKATPGVSDKTVSDWAKGYVALALQKKLLSSGADGTFGGTSAATRELLALGSYEAKLQYIPPVGPIVTNVSIVKAEATGAKTMTITLNGAIADTSKLNVSVLRGTTILIGTPKWNDTKNQVTITLDGKFTEGTYTAKIEAVKDGGLTVTDKGTADVAVQNEKITKIEFVNASDTVAQGAKVRVAFKAYNQYNEVSDLAASRFNIVTSPDMVKDVKGDQQALDVNVAAAVYGKTLVRDQLFAVTIIAPDNTAQASKTFKVGDVQSVAKVELGDFQYASRKTQIEAGDTAYINYKAYDQYGFEVTDLPTLISGTSTYTTGVGTVKSGTDTVTILDPVTNTNRIYNVNSGFRFVDSETGGNKPDLKIIAADSDSSSFQLDQDVTFSVVANQSGQTAVKSSKIASTKIPYEISFGNFNKTLAWCDDDQFVPVIAKDKYGNTLTADELASYVQKHPSDLSIYAYGSSGATVDTTIETGGANKGSIRITGLTPEDAATRKAGNLIVNVLVAKTGKTATFNSQVNEYRYPNQIYVSYKANDEILPNATSVFILKFKDQYGEELDKNFSNYRLELSLQRTNGTSTATDAVYAYLDYNPTVTIREANTESAPLVIDGALNDKRPGSTNQIRDLITGKTIRFSTQASAGDLMTEGTYQIKAKLVNKTTGTTISTSTSIDRIKADRANTDLVYSLSSFPNGVYAVDKLSDALSGLSAEVKSYFYGKLDIKAKDGSKTVALPDNKYLIKSIGLSNSAVAKEGTKAKLDGRLPTYSDNVTFDVYGLHGIKAGKTSVTVIFAPAINVIKQATLENINIVEDGITANSIIAGENGKNKKVSLAALNNLNLFNDDFAQNKTFGDVKVKDQFGNELKNAGLVKGDQVLGIEFYVSDLKWKQSIPIGATIIQTGSVTIDTSSGTAVYKYQPYVYQVNDGIPVTVDIDTFKANITTGNGKSVSIFVTPH